MFNVIINNEQYDAYLAQKEKIKELETRNNVLKRQLESAQSNIEVVTENYDLKKINKELKAKIKELEALYKFLEKEHAEISELNFKQGEIIINQDEMIETLQAKIADYDNKDIRFKELNSENYRLRMSNNDLKENNKKLNSKIKEYEHLNDYPAASSERAALINERDILKEKLKAKDDEISNIREQIGQVHNELEFIKDKTKKSVESITITPCNDLEEIRSPDRKTIANIENLYLTNNYFSEEDEDNE